MNRYSVIFAEQEYAWNPNRLTCTDGNHRYFYFIESETIVEAYKKAIEMVKKECNGLVRLVSCYKIDPGLIEVR